MDITEKQKKLIEKIAEKYSLRLLLLFGSQADGRTHKHSDFDVAYLSYRDLSLREECSMDVDLFPVCGSKKVDLVNIKTTSPLLKEHIFRNNKILFCSDKSVYNEYSIYAFKSFVEAKPLFALRDQLINNYFAKKKYA